MIKKIVYLSHWRFPSEKTMTPLILKTCEGHADEGFEVELWVPQRENPEFEHSDPFEVHNIKRNFTIRRIWTIDLMHFFGKLGFMGMVLSFNISALLLLRRENRQSTIVYGHDPRDFLFPSITGFPIFIEIHDFFIDGIVAINRWVLNRTRGLIVTNSYKIKIIQDQYGFPPERMIRQPNAVSFQMFDVQLSKSDARAQLGIPQEEKILLYTGHLFDWKGVYTLAEAALYLPYDTFIYFVGGTEEDRAALRKFVDDRMLPRIVFFPHQEHSKIPVFQKAADVLVLPNTAKSVASKYETSPVKLFEYMASGVPIVASDIPSLREIISNKEAWLFAADDPRSLAEATIAALNAPRGEKIEAARAIARTFSWESRGRAIANLIRSYS